MNSSAITNSIMPTVTIPGANASQSAGSDFVNVMSTITENWSERDEQIKYDAAKSAQNTWEKSRTDMKAQDRDRDYATADRNDIDDPSEDSLRRAERDRYDDQDDHRAKDAEPRDNDRRDVASDDRDADRSDDTPSREADSNYTAPEDPLLSSDIVDTETVSAEDVTDPMIEDADAANIEAQAQAQNQPVQTAALSGSAGATALAGTAGQAAQNSANGTQQAAAANAASGAVAAGTAAGTTAAAADGTTDGLMGSTALSQPVASASAKMALNATDDGTGDTVSADKFLSKVVENMSADDKAAADASNAAKINGQAANGTATANGTNGPAGANSTNAAQQGVNGTNPAQNAQVAQQAMAPAANAQNLQTNPNSPQGTTGANGTVTATGSADGSAQAVNGQFGTSPNNLHQSGAAGQSAHAARQAPPQPVQQQVAVSIKNAASDGVDKISVQLRPEHLGRVDVKLEIGQDGRVQGVIQADTRETLDMLRQDARALQQALKDAGLNADSQSFTFEHRNEGGQSQDGNGQSRTAANQGSTPDEGDVLSGTELAEHVAIGYGINPNGLVDIRI